jgi:Fic family protein
LNLIAKIDEFKGEWKAIGNLAPERLNALKHVATIESIGSSTRIEGVKLTDQEIERLLSGLDKKSFGSRDEQEVAGYADVMNIVFESYEDISFTENYIRQLHKMLLAVQFKGYPPQGEYKKMPNHVEAFDHDGKSLGVIFETSSPFDTPKGYGRVDGMDQAVKRKRTPSPVNNIRICGSFFGNPSVPGRQRQTVKDTDNPAVIKRRIFVCSVQLFGERH